MRIHLLPLAVLAMAFPIAGAVPAAAQRLSFERAIDVMPGATLDVSTIRGKIAVRADDGRQIRIDGTVTVRVGVTVPANALELAQRVADHPRVDVADNVVRLRPPIATPGSSSRPTLAPSPWATWRRPSSSRRSRRRSR